MKKTLAKTLLAVTAIAAPLLARADLIWYEGFNYPNGNITNNSITIDSTTYPMAWTNFSGGLKDMYVNSGHLEVSTTGNAVSSRSDDDARFLSLTNGSIYTNSVQVLYASFTVICTNLPNAQGSYFASFYNNGSGFCGRVLAYTRGTVVSNTWRLQVAGNSGAGGTNHFGDPGYPVDLALNTPYQVVEELDPTSTGLKAATVWINPVNFTQTGLSPAETHYTSSDSLGFATTTPINAFAFRQASSFGNGYWIITNLAIATSFAEAATNVWGTNALPPQIVYQPVGTTNFVNAPVMLTAIANGQGLGEMTYTWLQNGSPYPTGNGTNYLAIPSAQVSDSGDYKLVATTPYGLSVTSSVTKIAISAAPAPPQFTIQPGSQTIYSGQNMVRQR